MLLALRPLPVLQGMLITGILALTTANILAGLAADHGMPMLWATACMVVVETGLVFGAQAVFALNSLAASWVMQVGTHGGQAGSPRPGPAPAGCWTGTRAAARQPCAAKASPLAPPGAAAEDGCMG